MEPAPYEEVPYDDADAVNYGDDAQMYADAAPAQAPPAPSGSFGKQAAPGKPSGANHGGAPASQGSGQRTFGQPAQAAPASSAGTSAPAGASGAAAPGSVEPGAKVETFDAKSVPDDIPDDLRAIIEDAFEVFGDGVQISSVTPATSTSDEEASAELAAQQEADDQANPEDDTTGEGFVDDAEAGADEDDD